MSSRNLIYGIIAVVAGIVVWVSLETFNQPGVGDLKTEFKEISSFRNENNTGPIMRIYAVYAPDTLWEEIKSYGEFMPHTKYGNTKVYFFDQKEKTPTTIQPNEPFFDPDLTSNCLALYEKSAMGEVTFIRYPFR